MSDPASEPLDLEALACAFEQLELAAGSLARVVQRRHSRHDEGWEVVPSQPEQASGSAEPSAIPPAPKVDSPSPRPFRFRPAPRTDPSPSAFPPECLHICASLAPAVRHLLREKRFEARPIVWSQLPRLRSRTGATWSFGAPAASLLSSCVPLASSSITWAGSPVTLCTEGEARVYCRASGPRFPEEPSDLMCASSGVVTPYVAFAPVAALPRDRSAQ